MPLQIRRGTEADRLLMTQALAVGELLYVTDTQRLYVGNGSTLGGIAVTGYTNEDAQDAVAPMFTSGVHSNISYSYDDNNNRINSQIDLSSYTGNVSIVGSLNLSGDLQASAFKGSIFADDSTLLVDAVSGTIPYSVLSGAPTALSDFTNDEGFIKVSDIADGTVTIDVNNTGDLQGSVYGDDSTLLVDATNSLIPASVVSGTFTGNVVGTVTGTLVGDTFGNTTGFHTGDVKGSVFADNSTLLVDAVAGTIPASVVSGTFTGNVVGNLTGNTTGFHTGDVKGSVFAGDSSVMVDTIDFRLTATEGIIQTIETSTIGAPTGGSIRMQANNINIVTAGTAIFGNGNEDINSNIYVNRTLFTGTSLGGVTFNTSHGFTPDMDGLNFRRTRGPSSAPTTVQQFDVLGKIAFYGYNGTDYKPTMIIDNTADVINGTTVTSNLLIQSLNASGISVPRVRILADGRMMLGPSFTTDVSTETSGLEIFNTQYVANANSAGQPLVIRQFFDNADSNNFTIARNRGTRTAPTSMLPGDKIFEITCLGNDGTAIPRLSSRITFFTNGPITSGAIPGTISLDTADTAGTIRQRVQIREDGILYALFGIEGDLTGSVFSDSSTMLIDGTSGSLMMANVNMLGQTGNTPITPGSVDSWLEVTVNGNTKYIPLYV